VSTDISTGSIARLIEEDRLWHRLSALAEFGASEDGGVNRQALSTEEIAARRQLVAWGTAIGLQPHTDSVANLFLTYRGQDAGLSSVLIGSHIDSQPTGGKFDGAYGVLAALESVEAMIAGGYKPRRSITVVAWMNEEGSRFAPGMMGSAVYAGARARADILDIQDSVGRSVREELDTVLRADVGVPVVEKPPRPASYLELHIEQGPILELENKVIGAVTGIHGKRTYRVHVSGEENHAGTSPRSVRRDALAAAVDIVKALQDALWDRDDVTRFTVGQFTVTPNAPSVVPAKVVFSIDLRNPNADELRRLGDAIPETCAKAKGRCKVAVKELLHDPPLEFPPAICQMIGRIASQLDIPWMNIPSGAGHDARYLHYICPTGMIFIPCKDGISHNPAESILRSHATDGARVLAEAAFELANATEDHFRGIS
jgi:N-carbamoyl-L-amino-acid hydrolase